MYDLLLGIILLISIALAVLSNVLGNDVLFYAALCVLFGFGFLDAIVGKRVKE